MRLFKAIFTAFAAKFKQKYLISFRKHPIFIKIEVYRPQMYVLNTHMLPLDTPKIEFKATEDPIFESDISRMRYEAMVGSKILGGVTKITNVQ